MSDNKIIEVLESALKLARSEVVRLESALNVYTRTEPEDMSWVVAYEEEAAYIMEEVFRMVGEANKGDAFIANSLCHVIGYKLPDPVAHAVAKKALDKLVQEGLIVSCGDTGYYVK